MTMVDRLLFTQNLSAAQSEIEQQGGRVTHLFSDTILVASLPDSVDPTSLKQVQTQIPANLDRNLRLVVDAWHDEQLQSTSPGFDATEGLSWDTPGYEAPRAVMDPIRPEGDVAGYPSEATIEAANSPRLLNKVAVGIIIVSNEDQYKISESEQKKIIQEVQKGLNFFVSVKPSANLTFIYDIHFITVDATPCNPNDCSRDGFEICEAPWRNPAMKQLGYSANWNGVVEYVSKLRQDKGADWSYAAFFTKYPLCHFAYAGGPRLCMEYANDNWGPDNIHRVFAHETCHIFSAPDEYQKSNCSCDSTYGYLDVPNYNCVNCTGPHLACLMDKNILTLCDYSAWQIGWNNRLLLNDQCNGPSGGSGGDVFEEQVLPSGARISKVRVRSGNRIDAIGISYELDGVTTDCPMHGGNGGTLSEFDLEVDEYVTAVYGRYGSRLDSLTIQTNKRTSITYGGSGGWGDYKYMVTPGLEFAGFSGRAGSEVDALGWSLRQKGGGSGSDPTSISIGPSGGGGGDAFEDELIPPNARIKRVHVRSGSRIDAIGISYELNGVITDLPMHGGSGGTLTTFEIDDDDYIIGISGRYGMRVDSLIIQTFNKVYSVRYGGSGGDASYAYILAPDLEVVGFLGRAGSEVDAIGCIFRQRT